MPISPRIISPLFRPTFRSECEKPFLTLLALLASVTTPLLPVSAQSDNYKEPDYSKFKVEDGQMTIEVWSWVVGLDQVVKEFEQAFPNIKVHVNNVGGGPAEYQKLQTVLKAGSGAPDVVQIEYDFLPSFIATDGLADISQYGANDAKSYFVDWTWGQVSPDGKAVFGIPQDTGPMAFVYNKKIFDQYQLTVPTTWDEFAQQAEKLAKASDGKVKMAAFFPTHAPWFIGLAWASGGRYFTAKFYSALASDQIASSLEAAWGPGVFAASLKDKTAGEWRVAPLPQWSKDQPFRSGNWGGSCNSVTKQSKNPKAATLFAIWLNTRKAPVVGNWVNTGIFPASLSGLASPDLNDPEKNPAKFCGGQNIAQIYSDAAKAINVDFAWAPWFAYANDNYNKHIADLLSGSATVKQALDGWQNDCLKNGKDSGYDVKGQ